MPSVGNRVNKYLDRTGYRIISKNYFNIHRKTDLRGTFKGRYRNTSLLPKGANVGDSGVYFTMYKNEAPIRGAVKVIVNATVSQGWKLMTIKRDDVDEKDPRVIEIKKWLMKPDHSFSNVLRDLTLNLLIHDNSFAEVTMHEEAENNQGWIYPLDSRDVNWNFAEDARTLIGIKHQVKDESNAKPTLLGKDAYIHLALDKAGSAVGLSSLESLVRPADLLRSASDYNLFLFDSNGVPAVAFILEEGNEDDYEILRKATKNLAQGESFTAKGKIKTEVLGGKANEVGYEKLVDQVYQDVMTVWQIPPVLMSKPGASTLESSREETSSFSMNISAVQQIINNAVTRAIVKVWKNTYADIEEILFELEPWVNEKAQAAIDKIYLAAGVYVINDIRRKKGLEKVWYGDVPYNANAPLGLGLEPWSDAPAAEGTTIPANWPKAPEKPEEGAGGPGGQGDADGQAAEVERPERQATESNPAKLLTFIEDMTKAAKIREKQINDLMKANKKLFKVIENREKTAAYLARMYDKDKDKD